MMGLRVAILVVCKLVGGSWALGRIYVMLEIGEVL